MIWDNAKDIGILKGKFPRLPCGELILPRRPALWLGLGSALVEMGSFNLKAHLGALDSHYGLRDGSVRPQRHLIVKSVFSYNDLGSNPDTSCLGRVAPFQRLLFLLKPMQPANGASGEFMNCKHRCSRGCSGCTDLSHAIDWRGIYCKEIWLWITSWWRARVSERR